MKSLHRRTMIGFVAMVVALVAADTFAAGNLVPDPEFKKTEFKPLTYESSWMWYQINGPSEAVLNGEQKTIELTGGKTFLHSSRFPVKAGQNLKVALSAQGKGKVSVECLWWRSDGGTATEHRTIPIEPVELKDETKQLEATVVAPENAAQAYLRIVVEDGKIAVSKPMVTVAG